MFTVVASAATPLGCIDVPSRRELTTANNDSAACSGQYTCLEYKEQEQTQSNTSSKKMQETPILYTQTFISLSTHKNHGPAAATTKTNLKSTGNSEKMNRIQPPTPQPWLGAPDGPLAFVQHQVTSGQGLAGQSAPMAIEKNKNDGKSPYLMGNSSYFYGYVLIAMLKLPEGNLPPFQVFA